jgi:uncharacterized membrane protein YczE
VKGTKKGDIMGKRIGIYIVGLAFTALGIALIILSLLGAGPWDAVAVGINNHLGLTIGTWSIISQIMFTLITWLIEKSRFKIESVIPIVIRSWFLDFWFYIVLKNVDLSSSWELQWLSLIIGLILAGIGISAYMLAQFPKTPIDGLMIAISNRFGLSFNFSRMFIEITGVICGFLLGGPVGFGTVLIALLLGKIIQASNPIIKKVLFIQNEPVLNTLTSETPIKKRIY